MWMLSVQRYWYRFPNFNTSLDSALSGRLTHSNLDMELIWTRKTFDLILKKYCDCVKLHRFLSCKENATRRTTNRVLFLAPPELTGHIITGCADVPWYYWIGSLIAILLAVLITMTVFLIKLKRWVSLQSRDRGKEYKPDTIVRHKSDKKLNLFGC